MSELSPSSIVVGFVLGLLVGGGAVALFLAGSGEEASHVVSAVPPTADPGGRAVPIPEPVKREEQKVGGAQGAEASGEAEPQSAEGEEDEEQDEAEVASEEDGDEEPTLHGLDPEGIDDAVREVMSKIRTCYQLALTEVPDLEGGFKVHFEIEEMDGIGGVAELEIRDLNGKGAELVDAPMEECVLDAVEVLKFEVPQEPVVVDYPFLFSRG